MTVDLEDFCAEDVEEFLVAWLTPLRRTAEERRPGDPLPFTLVTHVAGTENVDEGYADPIVSVHTMCDKALGMVAAAAESKRTHRRLLYLSKHISDIALVNTRLVNISYLDVVETPRWEYYSDTILRKVGRYQVGIPYTQNIP
jgi:hypothetical protein